MRSFWKWTAVLIALGAVGAAVWFAVDRYRHRFARTGSDMVKLLPPGDLTTFFVDLAALRKGGWAHLFTGVTPAASEKDYRDFVAATGFDYTKDLDAIAGGVNDDNETFFIVKGRFDWDRLRQFVKAHSGTCEGDACQAPATKPRRWVNFVRLQEDVIGLAVSRSAAGADLLRPPGRRLQEWPPGDPVWVRLSAGLLKDPTALPAPLRIFAISMQNAQSVLLSAGKAERDNEAFTVQLDASFPSAPSADTACQQLQIQTKMLRLELARENRQPNPADLTGLLTAGSFQVGSTRIFGSWPVTKEFLRSLE